MQTACVRRGGGVVPGRSLASAAGGPARRERG